MFGREKLELVDTDEIAQSAWKNDFYFAEQANAVMDAMEARIKELEAELRKQKAWENYTGNDNGWV